MVHQNKEENQKVTRTANLSILRAGLFVLRIFGVNYWQTTSPKTFLYPGHLHMYNTCIHPTPAPLRCMVRQRPCLSPPYSPPFLNFFFTYFDDGLIYLETSKECILCDINTRIIYRTMSAKLNVPPVPMCWFFVNIVVDLRPLTIR